MLAARGKLFIFRAAFYLRILASPRMAKYRVRGMHLKNQKALLEGAYLFFRAPHGIELRAQKTVSYLFAIGRISGKVRLDIVSSAPEFETPPCRFSVRKLAGQGGFSHLLAARGKLFIFRAAFYLRILASPRMAKYRVRGMHLKNQKALHESAYLFC